jgi:hypothetical protein
MGSWAKTSFSGVNITEDTKGAGEGRCAARFCYKEQVVIVK